MAGATAPVHLDLAGDVAGRRTDARLCCSVNYGPQAVGICLASIIRALHENLGGGPKIVVFHVDVIGIVQGIYPHAIVEGNPGSGRIRSAESIRAVSGVAACNLRCCEADHGQIWNVQVEWVRTVHRDVAIASARRQPARGAKSGYEDAAIRLTFVFKRQSSVRVRSTIGCLVPAP